MPTVTDEERERFSRQVAALRAEESDEYGSDDERAGLRLGIDRWRAEHGVAPLRDDCADASILDLDRRARRLGLRRPPR